MKTFKTPLFIFNGIMFLYSSFLLIENYPGISTLCLLLGITLLCLAFEDNLKKIVKEDKQSFTKESESYQNNQPADKFLEADREIIKKDPLLDNDRKMSDEDIAKYMKDKL